MILVGDLRRTKIDPDLGKTINNDNGKADAWNIDASSSIKIPQYRRPSALHEKSNVLHKPALTLPRSSPFISNKIDLHNPILNHYKLLIITINSKDLEVSNGLAMPNQGQQV